MLIHGDHLRRIIRQYDRFRMYLQFSRDWDAQDEANAVEYAKEVR